MIKDTAIMNMSQPMKQCKEAEASSEKVSLLVEKCCSFGRQQEYELVIDTAASAMQVLDEIQGDLDYNVASSIEATILGYKGFAFMKINLVEDAIQALSRSYELRTSKKREVALVDGKRGIAKKKGANFTDIKPKRINREFLTVEKSLARCCALKGIRAPLPPMTKFSRTAHLFDAGGTAVTADDLVLSKDAILFKQLANRTRDVIIEEKIDGANFGISLTADGKIITQNRSHYISRGDHVQFSAVSVWIEEHRLALMKILAQENEKRTASQGLILYGEWVVARHSISYDKLPGQFIAFDIYDRYRERFFSRARFHDTMKGTDIPVVPVIDIRRFGPFEKTGWGKNRFEDQLKKLLETPSRFRKDGVVEGVVLRVDEQNFKDDNNIEHPLWLEHRVKIVRPDFVAGCADGHWSSRPIEKQLVDYDFAIEYLAECYPCASEAKVPHEKSGYDGINTRMAVEEKQPAAPSDPVIEKNTPSKSELKMLKEQFAAKSRLRRRAPKFVMLMGMPAAGKSTFSNTLASEWEKLTTKKSHPKSKNGWVIVNQDKLGKKACIDLAGRSAHRGRVILDRCNATQNERKVWMGILHCPPKSETALIYFATDVDTCIDRAQKRIGHDTIPERRGERIIQDMVKRLEPPCDHERREIFGSIDVVRTFEDSRAILKRWGCS